MMRRLVSILLLFVMSVFSLSSSISDVQNFQITAFLREHSNQNPGEEGSPEYYYHILARNLYNAVNVENGVAVQMGQGTSLYGNTPVPLFRIEYVTNYLDGVDITVNVSPFKLWNSDKNAAETEVTGNNPLQLTTKLKAKAGFAADHETLTYLQSYGTFVDPGTKYQDEKPDMVEFSGGFAKIQYNKEEKLNSKTANSFEWVSPQEYEASTEKTDLFSFSYILQKLDEKNSYWNNDGYDWGRWTYSWSFVEKIEEWEGTSKDFIEDGGMITNYIEYSARIDRQEMPVAPAGQRLEYRMNVTITVENSL